MQSLTEKQRRLFEFVAASLDTGVTPTQREIAAHFGLSQNAVYQLLRYLRQKGYLAQTAGHRSLRLSERYLAERGNRGGIPILGRVAAGRPILAEENLEGYFKPTELLPEDGRHFMLRVAGNSMVEEGIMDGDYVLVHPQKTIGNRQIAVVLVDSEATVKRVKIKGRHITLIPANRAEGYRSQTYHLTKDNVSIVGKVVACVRKLPA